ncbi:MAG: rhomboid family intramembrane serine protease [Bacteroidales bacterium]|nr:rhomboid family intramembrane serine protease [Bacteroidales bacterium]
MQSIKSIATNNMANKLILANVVVFLLVSVASLVNFLLASPYDMEGTVLDYLAVPAALDRLASRFWTPLTYMFLHTGFWHIFANMLWLYFLGKVFLDVFDGRRLLAVYILGGLAGALFFVGAYNIFPAFEKTLSISCALGASAAVSAVVIAVCVYRPQMQLYFFGILPLSLKWLGIIYVVIDLLQIAGSNPGGHISHLGGAAFGCLFAICLKNGKDITRWFCSMIDNVVLFFSGMGSSNPKMKVSYRKGSKVDYSEATTVHDEDAKSHKSSDAPTSDETDKIDRILEKISKSGYNNLTKEEKDYLFTVSRKK